ncbi:MAG: hypothetical protein NTV39_00775 [Candidatus Saccharibacteria bacterium]|nr:hypothetical protein [Candidatus Saccharibacteria bacterium]
MTKKNIFQTIKNKEMDRKDFLKYSGLTLAAVVGLKGIISILSAEESSKIVNNSHKDSTHGFGSGKYGV